MMMVMVLVVIVVVMEDSTHDNNCSASDNTLGRIVSWIFGENILIMLL